MKSEYPQAYLQFCTWLCAYKLEVGWEGAFFKLPLAMQVGVIAQYEMETFQTIPPFVTWNSRKQVVALFKDHQTKLDTAQKLFK